ncbi:MAG: hypothetical protein MUQ65_02895 [Armatimonadetes bacterium]|nr:hypothetical protein [Armatimonadota bacterium]
MTRLHVLGLTLLLLITPSLCLAQVDLAGASPSDGDLPDFAGRTVPGEAVVDLADFIAEYLGETGTVPDFVQVETAAGSLRTISAVEAFVLLARTSYLWQFNGNLPETVPIAPDEVSLPVLDPEDVVAPPGNPEAGREIPTEAFLAQCPAVVRWVDRLQVVPTAVWVDGQRLSAAECLAGLAICVSYAYWEGQLYDSIFLPAYAPPQSWVGEAEPVDYAEAAWAEEDLSAQEAEEVPAETYSETYWEEEDLSEEAAYSPRAPLYGPVQEPVYQGEPTLIVYPEPGTTVSGLVDVIASYSGPEERFVIFVFDTKAEVMMNFPPYGYRWDTTTLEPGVHTVRVQVLGDDDAVLADQTSAFMVVPTESESSPVDSSDDL